MFEDISQFKKISFSTCEGCLEGCCSGARIICAPLLVQDFHEVYERFPILFAYLKDEGLKAFVLLTNGQKACRYFKDNKCSIYEFRPPACRTYPLSPYYEKIFVDTSCPGVMNEGIKLYENKQIHQNFYHSRFENFVSKYEQSALTYQEYEKHLSYKLTLLGMDFFEINIETEDSFLHMHQYSLKNLDYFLENPK